MSDAGWIAFWTNLPYLIGAMGTCVVPGVTAWLMMRAHRANLKSAEATRNEVVAAKTELGAVKGLVTAATETVKKIEDKANGMHDKIVELTEKEATARGHLAGKAEAVAEQKDLQEGRPR